MPQTLSNLADAQVALGEAALAAGQPSEGQAAFEAALQSYQASCALSDSANGAVSRTGLGPAGLCRVQSVMRYVCVGSGTLLSKRLSPHHLLSTVSLFS
jgi:hypothetical protein